MADDTTGKESVNQKNTTEPQKGDHYRRRNNNNARRPQNTSSNKSANQTEPTQSKPAVPIQPKPAVQPQTPQQAKPANTAPGTQQQKTQQNNQFVRKQQPAKSNILISVVIPLFNEEESIAELALQLEGELDKFTNRRWEVIFIDDGSTDGSFNVLKKLNERNRRFKAIRFRRNYGKSAALSVGFNAAQGMLIVTMDADLQDDPSEIQNLVAKIKEGYDLVSGWKKKRNDPINKTLPSKFWNFVTSKASGIKLHDFNCGLKAYRSEAAKSLQVYGEMHRYLPALAHWNGFRVTEIPVLHHARRYGRTKFGATRGIKGILDLLTVLFTTRYLKRPLHFFGTIGVLLTLSGLAINCYLVAEWLMGRTYLSNRPLALFGIALIIVGVQSVTTGLIGEMIAKNSLEKQTYSIKERLF